MATRVNSGTLPSNRVESQESGFAPFETLFHDLKLRAYPVYNFWEPEEETVFRDRGTASTEDVPRYVKLKWQVAPDLPDTRSSAAEAIGTTPDARNVFVKLSPFGFGAKMIVGSNMNGATWSPAHLQPQNFSQAAASVANGYLAPGVLEGVSEVLTGSVAPPAQPTAELVDEDEFLSHDDLFEGISYSEYNATIWRWLNSTYSVQQAAGTQLSAQGEIERRYFFNNQYVFPNMQPTQDVATFDLKAVGASGPQLSLQANSAVATDNLSTPRVFELAKEMGATNITDKVESTEDPYQRVKVKLVSTNLQGLVSEERVVATSQPQHAENIIALAPFVGNLAVYSAANYQNRDRSINIPSFDSPADLKPLEYVGYIIEKFQQIDGSFRLVETINVPGREFDEYHDTRVLYGVAYRYRIRAVLRWSRPRTVGVLGEEPTNTGGTTTLTTNRVSFFASEWAKEWAAAVIIDTSKPLPPDELVARPFSKPEMSPAGVSRPYVMVSFKLPYNPQQDISKITLWRKIKDEASEDATGWVQVHEFDAENRQGTKLAVSLDLRHQQDDLTGTKIAVDEHSEIVPFVEYAPANGLFIDWDVKYFGLEANFRYVYAAMCHTRHGETSALSDQLAVRLNPNWKKDGEYDVEFVSCAGVQKDFDTGIFSTYPEKRIRSEFILKSNEKLAFYAQTRVASKPLSSNKYTVRIESLDTGEHVDLPVSINVVNRAPEVVTKQLSVLFPNTTG